MNFLDIIIVVILGFCLIRGIFRGFIKETSSIVGVFGGLYAALYYYHILAKLIAKWAPDLPYLDFISFLVLFFAVYFAVTVLAFVIKYLLKTALLGWFDRTSGAVFGLIKGVLIASILLVALTAFLPKSDPRLKSSALSPYIVKISKALVIAAPSSFKRQFEDKFSGLKKFWKK